MDLMIKCCKETQKKCPFFQDDEGDCEYLCMNECYNNHVQDVIVNKLKVCLDKIIKEETK